MEIAGTAVKSGSADAVGRLGASTWRDLLRNRQASEGRATGQTLNRPFRFVVSATRILYPSPLWPGPWSGAQSAAMRRPGCGGAARCGRSGQVGRGASDEREQGGEATGRGRAGYSGAGPGGAEAARPFLATDRSGEMSQDAQARLQGSVTPVRLGLILGEGLDAIELCQQDEALAGAGGAKERACRGPTDRWRPTWAGRDADCPGLKGLDVAEIAGRRVSCSATGLQASPPWRASRSGRGLPQAWSQSRGADVRSQGAGGRQSAEIGPGSGPAPVLALPRFWPCPRSAGRTSRSDDRRPGTEAIGPGQVAGTLPHARACAGWEAGAGGQARSGVRWVVRRRVSAGPPPAAGPWQKMPLRRPVPRRAGRRPSW